MVASSTFSGLRRLLTAAPAPPKSAGCELCGAPLGGKHSHVADTSARRLLCACEHCANAAMPDAGMQLVAGRYLHESHMWITAEQWAGLDVPVDLAFFFFSAALGRVVASYPGAAGAIESPLPIDRWQSLVAAHPWARIRPDVEALLVRRVGGAFQCFVTPIDRCYELVGRIRTSWSGMDGGEAVRLEVDRFFADLTARCGGAA
ncbi:MAG TPA: DUF5947 family protein [Vicinamibacterales bacterium]|nr:DUF5947 family protein [Vicinamibacterales bacterium]